MSEKTIRRIIKIAMASLLIPVVVIILIEFICPFYFILCKHLITTPCAVPYIFNVWIAQKDWTFLGAIGTVSAVLFALFKDIILKYINRPILDVIIEEKKRPYIFNIPQSVIETYGYVRQVEKPIGNTVYLSFQVINSGKSLAKNVAVKVKKISNDTLDMFLTPENIGINIEKITRDIPAKTGSYWNYIEIADPKFRKDNPKYRVKKNLPENEPVLLIPITYRLSIGHHIVNGGKYDIDILIIADEIKAIERTIEVDTSGLKQWPVTDSTSNEDEIREKEEEEISAKIKYGVKEEKTCFYEYKSCIKGHLTGVKKNE